MVVFDVVVDDSDVIAVRLVCEVAVADPLWISRLLSLFLLLL